MKKKEKFVVLSPDGINIEFDKLYYSSLEKAKVAFVIWKTRYESQGYYSSNYGRIPLEDLENHCTFKTI